VIYDDIQKSWATSTKVLLSVTFHPRERRIKYSGHKPEMIILGEIEKETRK